MKNTNDAPKVYSFNERRAWKIGYNQCLTDHEYMATHAQLQANLRVSEDRIDALEKQLSEALRRIPARHAETKVKQVDQIAPTNLPFWGIVETDALSKPCGV